MNNTLLKIKSKQNLEHCSKIRCNSTYSSEGDAFESPEDPSDPEEPEEENAKESTNNNNFITVVPEHNKDKLYTLGLDNLKSKPIIIYDSLFKDKDLILSSHKSVSGVYLLHNLVNGKQYVGSGYDLRKRLATYYFPSRLTDNRYISNSLLKYGHDNFSLAILEILSNKYTYSKSDLILKEQFYIDLYKPLFNINPRAGSSLGFKHTE